jgi:cell division protease FtsH
MNTKLKSLEKKYLSRMDILDSAKKVLKSELFGIDNIIDEIIDNVTPWYIMPEIQEKPLVINLWGLTGVGKTALVSRLAMLLGYNNRFFRFDLGEKEGRYSFRHSLEDLCEMQDDDPIIIALDEIQHSRTVNGPFRKEMSNPQNRMIWELIDSGEVQYINWKRGLWTFDDYLKTLEHLLNAGVKVRNGMVASGKKLFCREMNIEYERNKQIPFVDENMYEEIIYFAGKQLGLPLLKDVQRTLLQFSGKDTIQFLNKVLAIAKRPSVKNFTKSLIFVLGNLDEAYTMSSNISADIDADEFHKQSLKITIPKIKTALQERFRDEQIARLGNIHIIYPALDRQTYIKIIEHSLENYAQNIFQQTGVSVKFSKSVVQLVYDDGVYPTQGVRPVFTSMNYLIKSKTPVFISEILHNNLSADEIIIKTKDNNLEGNYYTKAKLVYHKQVRFKRQLESIRKSKYDDNQAITAVHESGHALLSIVLMKTIPQIIYSVTSDANNQGFIYSDFAWDYISRKEIIPRVALLLGGYAAEEYIFGSEHLTTGAASDIKRATEFLSRMYKKEGMGKFPISYSIIEPQTNDLYHNYNQVEDEIRLTVEKALELARNTLIQEKQLLLVLADYLSDHRMLTSAQTEQFVSQHLTMRVTMIKNGSQLYYRNKLKEVLQNPETNLLPTRNNSYLLNKKK